MLSKLKNILIAYVQKKSSKTEALYLYDKNIENVDSKNTCMNSARYNLLNIFL